MQSTILSYFPYPTPRPVQAEVLQLIEKEWENYDVFCLVVPVAGGKTALARTLQQWTGNASCITPSNLLVNQFLEEFPATPTLHRLDSYWCGEWLQSCAATRGRRKKFCSGCTCSGDLSTAKYRRGPGIYNYYTYMAHRLYRKTLVIDEAHGVINTIQDRLAQIVWRHDYRWPSQFNKPEQILDWILKQPARIQAHKKILQLKQALTDVVPSHVIQFTEEAFNGKGTLRGEPEMRACIKLYPVDVREAPPMLWPTEVEKIIMMSATIGPVDIEALGLASRRVLYIQSGSPIPVERRPIQLLDVVDLNHQNLEDSVPAIAAELANIAAYHSSEKGIIHATYRMAELLRGKLDSRFMFHTQLNKRERYEAFRLSPPSEGRILVACGMFEGIDLPEDLGRWQVIIKCPWKSLGDAAIKYKAEKDPDWYNWETLKDLIQASGRICRTPTDYGTTYILDSSVHRLLEQSSHLLPKWFEEAIV